MAYTSNYLGQLTAAAGRVSTPKPPTASSVASLYGPPPDNSYLNAVKPPPPPAASPAPATSTSSAPPSYSFDADPVLAQIRSATAQQVAQAQAAALAQRQGLAVNLGDPGLANSLGLGADYASAASGNPYSTLARLQHAYDLSRQNTQHSYDLTTQDLARQLADAQHQADLSKQTVAQQHTQTLAQMLADAAKANLIHGSVYANQTGLENTNYQRSLDELARGLAETTQQNQLAQSEAKRNLDQSLSEGAYNYQGSVYDAEQQAQQQLAAIASALVGAQQQAQAQQAQAETDAANRAIQMALQYGTPS